MNNLQEIFTQTYSTHYYEIYKSTPFWREFRIKEIRFFAFKGYPPDISIRTTRKAILACSVLGSIEVNKDGKVEYIKFIGILYKVENIGWGSYKELLYPPDKTWKEAYREFEELASRKRPLKVIKMD